MVLDIVDVDSLIAALNKIRSAKKLLESIDSEKYLTAIEDIVCDLEDCEENINEILDSKDEEEDFD